jgi:hypothetical protein
MKFGGNFAEILNPRRHRREGLPHHHGHQRRLGLIHHRLPRVGMAACAEDGPGCFAPIYNGMVASSYAASVTGTAVSVCMGDDPICSTSACGVAVVPGHDLPTPATSISTYGIATPPGRAVSHVGAPCMPSSICPSVGAAIAAQRNSLARQLEVEGLSRCNL